MSEAENYGQIGLDAFLDNFTPKPGHPFVKEEHNTSIDLQYMDVTAKSTEEEKLCYPALCTFINKALGGDDGSIVCKDMADWPDNSLEDSRCGDLQTFRKSCQSILLWEDPNLVIAPRLDEDRVRHASRNSFGHTLFGIQPKLLHPGFGKNASESFLREGAGAENVRGQLCDHATEIQLRQSRQFVFMVHTFRATARLLRFDRVGVIVSEPIDLTQEPEKLYEFFYRLRNASDVELGLDPTTTHVSSDTDHPSLLALNDAIDALPVESRLKPYIEDAFDGEQWPIYQMDVPDIQDTGVTHSFLVRNLSTSSVDPTGRATKGYIAFDIHTKKFCFLKDYWRPDSQRIHKELDVHAILQKKNIPNTTTVHCGGDLHASIASDSPDDLQVTRTQYFQKKSIYLPRIHTRIVLNELGIPLQDYATSRELCTCVLFAFNAHRLAWTKAQILHRDISDGNIIIHEKQTSGKVVTEGLLIDWDLCKYRDELDYIPSQNIRSGTWRFLSGTLLRYPLKPNSVADDIESFYHLLMLFALRFHPHNKPQNELQTILEYQYDACTSIDGYWIGSDTKFNFLQIGVMPCTMLNDDAFTRLLRSLLDICKEHYSSLDFENLAMYAIPLSAETRGSTPLSESSESSDVLDKLENMLADIECPRSPITISRPVHKGRPLLDDHNAFAAAMLQALRSNNWLKEDKLDEDQFEIISWDSGSVSKRMADEAGSALSDASQPPKKKTRLSAPKTSVRGSSGT